MSVAVPDGELDSQELNQPYNMTSMVNKQHRIKSARTRCPVPEGHPMVQVGFEGSRHMIPERLPSAKGRKASSLRVIDLNDDTTKLIKEVSSSLKRLDLSNLHLVKLSDDFISHLSQLEKLDIGFNELTEDSFPPTFRNLESLVELSAHHNNLSTLPKVVRKLRTLTRLKLRANCLEDIEGLEKLKRLQVLVLDENKLQTLGKEFLTNMKKLEILHCSSNLLKDIPPDIRHLRYLRDLDISNNKLTYLPPEILLLPRIEVLSAGGNDISRIPTINVKGRVKRKLSSVDLSDNSLVKFPEHLLYMTDRLDLSHNWIKVIPGTLIQKLDWGTDKQLVIDGNPLTVPPQDVCECGIRAIMQYFQEAKADLKIYQGLKVLVLGASGQGKTSLIQSIVDQQPRLTEDERTMGADSYDFSVDIEEEGNPNGKTLHLSMWDFSGNIRYVYQHFFFLEQPSLVLLVFNMAEYDVTKFPSLIGTWIDCIIAKTNKIVILPVGTHRDKVPKSKVKSICESAYHSITGFIDEHKKSIQQEIKTIESMPHISPALSEQLKHYLALLKVQFTVHDEVIPVSCTSNTDLDTLVKAIETMATNKNIFPNVLKSIPSLWGEVENYIEDRGYAMSSPFMTWKMYSDEISNKFGMKHLMEQITQYLHDTGKVLWFSDNPLLKEYVFLRPSWLTDILKQLFRHDVADLDYTMEESFKQLNVNQAKFEKMKREVLEEGVFDREYLKCIWYSLTGTEFTRPVLEIINLLIERFEIGYGVVKASKEKDRGSSAVSRSSAGESKENRERLDSAGTVRSVRFDRRGSLAPSEKSEKSEHSDKLLSVMAALPSATKPKEESSVPRVSKIIVPWLRETKQPKAFKEEYEKFTHRPSLAAVFRFPKFVPPAFFEVLVVRTQRADNEYFSIYHWKSGLYVKHKEKPLRFYLLRISHEDGSTCIRMETRLEEIAHTDEKETDILWSVMLPILKDTEEVLAKLAGVRVERYMECPHCHSLSFLGEWQTPKELQSLSSKVCESCGEAIDSCFLIQPKERRRVEELITQKKMQQEAERRSKTLETMKEEEEKEEKEGQEEEAARGSDPPQQ